MADKPRFTSTPRIGIGSVSTANTNRDGTGTIVDVLSAVGITNGTLVSEVVAKATGDPADSILTLFIHDGSSWHLFDEIDLADQAAASTTVTGYRVSTAYTNLVLPAGYKLGAAITVALTAGVIKVIALGGDLT
jgi:uncharacterized protein YeaO (DUF488 family)